MRRWTTGFTLIELLIVVAIIAILAAIAVPNFIEAQTRAKIARVKTDLRTCATGLESYRVDHNRYPIIWYPHFSADYALVPLTSPIAYLTSIPRDPFFSTGRWARVLGEPHASAWAPPHDDDFIWGYFRHTANYGNPVVEGSNMTYGDWHPFPSVEVAILYSDGPSDQSTSLVDWFGHFLVYDTQDEVVNRIYNATNGTNSVGAIYRVMGDSRNFLVTSE